MARPGRPKSSPAALSTQHQAGESAREKLLEAANTCFTQNPYHKVTTRMLAAEAGVTPALIRYYFINKEGLYKAMFESVSGKVFEFLEEYATDQALSIDMLPRAFHQVVKSHPQFPILMVRELVLGEGVYRDFMLKVVKEDRYPRFKQMIENLKKTQKIRQDIDPTFLHLQMVSTVFFPWLMRNNIEIITGQTFDDQFAERLFQHNLKVLQYGCLNPSDEQNPSGA